MAGLPNSYLRRRWAVLFYSLLATLAMTPLASLFGQSGRILEFLLLLNLAVVSLSASESSFRHPSVAAVGLIFILRVASAIPGFAELRLASQMCWVPLALTATVAAVRFAFRARAINAEHVYAALAAYLLAGYSMGVAYWIIGGVFPGAFQIGGQPIPLEGMGLSDAIYFSFVTLATLGYGDIVPANETARGLAIVEAISGQLYVAVLIARLVSLQKSAHEE